MRETKFSWEGKDIRLTPSLALLQRIALELRQTSGGTETTVSLASKCVRGGLEPMFLFIPLKAFMEEACGAETPSDQDLLDHLLSNLSDALSFRLAYVEAVLPVMSPGKEAAVPSALKTAKASDRKGRKKKSTLKASTSLPA